MRGRKWLALVMLQVFAFAQSYTATAYGAAVRTPVLKHVLYKHVKASMGQLPALNEEAFVRTRDEMVAKVDSAIERLSHSTLDDGAFRAQAQRKLSHAARQAEKRLNQLVTEQMTSEQVAEALGQAQGDQRYARTLARHKDPREALAACVALDFRAATLAAQKSIAAKTKADVLAELTASRDKLTALKYDGGDYDEFYEFTWYCWHSDDVLIVWIFFVPMLIVDTVLTPFVAIYKICHYFFID